MIKAGMSLHPGKEAANEQFSSSQSFCDCFPFGLTFCGERAARPGAIPATIADTRLLPLQGRVLYRDHGA